MMVGEGGGICMHGLEASESALCTIHEWGLDFGSRQSRQEWTQRAAGENSCKRKAATESNLKGLQDCSVEQYDRVVSKGSKEELNLE
jgi:hypothetical protein